MCGRYALTADLTTILQHFQLLSDSIVLKPRYNIAPSQVILIVKDGQLAFANWGFVPEWLNKKESVKAHINARVETVLEKPTFARAFKRRRCLIVASGYYEWKQIGKCKQPYYIKEQNGQLLGFAGVLSADDGCAILTKQTTDKFPCHRMPVVIKQEHYNTWLHDKTSFDVLTSDEMWHKEHDFMVYPVSREVNNPKFDEQLCTSPLNS